MTDLDPSAGEADDAGPRIRGRARSKAGEAADLRNADAERRAARISVRWLPVESLTPDPENARSWPPPDRPHRRQHCDLRVQRPRSDRREGRRSGGPWPRPRRPATGLERGPDNRARASEPG